MARFSKRQEGLFRLACENDLEGIVAKRKSDPYLPECKLAEGSEPMLQPVGRTRGAIRAGARERS